MFPDQRLRLSDFLIFGTGGSKNRIAPCVDFAAAIGGMGIGITQKVSAILPINRDVVFPIVHAERIGADFPIADIAYIDDTCGDRSVILSFLTLKLGLNEAFTLLYSGCDFYIIGCF